MADKMRCPCCEFDVPFKEAFVGRKVKCPACDSKFRVLGQDSFEVLERSYKADLPETIADTISKAGEENLAATLLEDSALQMPEMTKASKATSKRSSSSASQRTSAPPFKWVGLAVGLVLLGIGFVALNSRSATPHEDMGEAAPEDQSLVSAEQKFFEQWRPSELSAEDEVLHRERVSKLYDEMLAKEWRSKVQD